MKNTRFRGAFTLIELLVVVVIIGVLAMLITMGLSRAKKSALAAGCVQHQKLILEGISAYTANEDGYYPPMSRPASMAGFPTSKTMAQRVVADGALEWWPDALMHYGYVDNPVIFNCTVLRTPATIAKGGTAGMSPLGIGLSYNGMGKVLTAAQTSDNRRKLNEVSYPGATVALADAGRIGNPGDSNPDAWESEDDGSAHVYWRMPDDGAYAGEARRPVGRHNSGEAAVGFVDGHADLLKNAAIGLQYAKGNEKAQWDLE